MKLEGNCQTTAMGILPHTDAKKAMDLAMSLDIPFWPQLPRLSYYEDMYVQISEHFPGIILDLTEQSLRFSLEKFYVDIDEFLLNWDNMDYFRLSDQYALLYNQFLSMDLSAYRYIRGQTIGPVSFGLKILDEEKRPMIYHQEVRELVFDFVAKKITAQYEEMHQKHAGSFVWVDEPGLQMIFMAMTGYTSENALKDYREFLKKVPGPKGVHLCGNPDWSFLLQLDLQVLSIDILAWGHIFTRYKEEIKAFLDRGGIISWGITPTLTEEYEVENAESMIKKLDEMWGYLDQAGISYQQLLKQAWLAPARCCLINTDGTETVEASFRLLSTVANHFKKEIS